MLGLIIIVIIACIGHLLKDSFTEKETFLTEPKFPVMEDNYAQRMNEIVNTDRVLDRPVKAAANRITKLIIPLSNPVQTDKYKQIGKHKQKTLRFTDQKELKIPKNHQVYTFVDERQPYMFDQPTVIDNSGKKFYWDWRYPRKPIDIRFAIDPVGYCKKHPNTYP